MKISDVMYCLRELKKMHGDVEVIVRSDGRLLEVHNFDRDADVLGDGRTFVGVQTDQPVYAASETSDL